MMAEQNTQPEVEKSELKDIRKYIKYYVKHWYYFIIFGIVFGLIGLGYIYIAKEKYEVLTNVIISQENAMPLPSMNGIIGDIFGSGGIVDDEIYRISSHSVYKDVARELGMNIEHRVRVGFLNTIKEYEKFPVDLYAPAGISDTLMTNLVFVVNVKDNGKADVKFKAKGKTRMKLTNETFPITLDTKYGNFILNKTQYFPVNESFKTTLILMSYDRAAEDIDKDIIVELASKKANIIKLTTITPYPIFGKKILNTIVEQYNSRGIEEKSEQGQRTDRFIEERLQLISNELAQTEQSIQQYKQQQGLVDLEADAQYNFKVKGETELKLVEAQANAEILKMTLDFLTDPSNAYDPLPGLVENADGLSDALRTYNELILKRINMLAAANEDNPAVRQLTLQIDAMRQSINVAINKAYQNAQVTVREIQDQYNRANSRLVSVPSQERDYLNLARQQAIQQQIYVYLLQHREENAMLTTNSTPKALVVDEAYILHEPVGKSRPVLIAIFLLFGFCAAFAWLYVRILLKPSVVTDKE